MAQSKILDVPTVASDPLRKQYIGKVLAATETVGKTGGVMHTVPPAGGIYFWPGEFEAA